MAGSYCISFLVAIALFLILSVDGHTFYVGEEDGWTPNTCRSYETWANTHRFRLNDELVFKYEKGHDSVLVVNGDDYVNCNRDNPMRLMRSGDSKYRLMELGKTYFISGHDENCEKGQKFIVDVMPPAASPIGCSIPTPPSPSPVGMGTTAPVHAPSPSRSAPVHAPSPAHVGVAPVQAPSLSPLRAGPVRAPSPSPGATMKPPPTVCPYDPPHPPAATTSPTHAPVAKPNPHSPSPSPAPATLVATHNSPVPAPSPSTKETPKPPCSGTGAA